MSYCHLLLGCSASPVFHPLTVVVEITPVERVVLTYGFESGQPIPIGASRVTITLEETARGTLVRLKHELPSAEVRDEHVQGWRYQLAVFANVVAKEAHAGVGALADRFFALWGKTRQCQGLAIVDWNIKGPDGNPRGKGSNAFELAPGGRIARATGIWG